MKLCTFFIFIVALVTFSITVHFLHRNVVVDVLSLLSLTVAVISGINVSTLVHSGHYAGDSELPL